MKSSFFKRCLATVSAVALCLAATPLSLSAAFDPVIGDVNTDGAINSKDVRALMYASGNNVTLPTNRRLLADMNGDGLCDTTDGRLIFQKSMTAQPELIPLSGFEDSTNVQGYCTYTMRAEYTDTYTFSCATATSLKVTTDKGTVSGTTSVVKDIVAGETVTIVLRRAAAYAAASLSVTARDHYQRLPFEPNFTVDPKTLDTVGNASVDPLDYAELDYQKRDGGTYVYLNNPEKLQPADVGQNIMRNEGLTGDVLVTWEHSNFTGKTVYLGYQLKNDGDSDVFVTVTNVGYQVQGEWLGQQSWSDYYNRQFNLPSDYFDANGRESARYEGQDFLNYTPRVYQPTTYRIPAGKYIYVVGGTTGDAYGSANVGATANKQVLNGKCTNAVAKFRVTGGEVTGSFLCYLSSTSVPSGTKQQGYITERSGTQFGLQYKGVDYHQGLIESNPVWTVNDLTPAQNLPVLYKTAYDSGAYWNSEPYAAYDSSVRSRYETLWRTNSNPQSNSRAVGKDMMSFECVTTDGKTVTIDTEHADCTGKPANLGNWMVDYQDNMTFVNQGSRTRWFTINKNANGALMAMVLDADGNVLTTKCTIRPIEASPTAKNYELYTVAVPPHSVKQITVNFLLMGNSYGDVSHWVTLT